MVHDLHLAAQIADDVVLLRQGRVVAAGTAQAMLTEPLIEATYRVAVEIGTTPRGQRFILPVAR